MATIRVTITDTKRMTLEKLHRTHKVEPEVASAIDVLELLIDIAVMAYDHPTSKEREWLARYGFFHGHPWNS